MKTRYLVYVFFFLTGCTFDSSVPLLPIPNLGLGVSCLQVTTRFIPTPTGITTGSPDTALPIDIETCKNYAAANNISWTFSRLEPPSPQVLAFPLANPENIQLVFDDGVPYCIIKRGLNSQVVNDIGVGTWQVTHHVNDWSVTCEEVEITECPREGNFIDYWASYTTVPKGECVQQMLGVDILEPEFP